MSTTTNTDIPLVAVYVVTYNHERYIAQTIESIVNQKTDFKFKLFIGEDCSKDNTRAICKEYEKKYPDIIEAIYTTENNLKVNCDNISRACVNSGAKYIAICEGDDYWIDPYKLQKQADFLESHSDYSMCFSAVKVDVETGEQQPYDHYFPKIENETLTIKDIILTGMNIAPTATLFYRNNLPEEIHVLSSAVLSADIFLQLFIADTGKLKYFPEQMAVYRVHAGGITKSKENMEKGDRELMKLFVRVNEMLHYKYDALFRQRLLEMSKMMLIFGARNKKGIERIKHYFKTMPDYLRYSDPLNLKEFAYYHLVLFFPSFLKRLKK